jgi:hypothetical protein
LRGGEGGAGRRLARKESRGAAAGKERGRCS